MVIMVIKLVSFFDIWRKTITNFCFKESQKEYFERLQALYKRCLRTRPEDTTALDGLALAFKRHGELWRDNASTRISPRVCDACCLAVALASAYDDNDVPIDELQARVQQQHAQALSLFGEAFDCLDDALALKPPSKTMRTLQFDYGVCQCALGKRLYDNAKENNICFFFFFRKLEL